MIFQYSPSTILYNRSVRNNATLAGFSGKVNREKVYVYPSSYDKMPEMAEKLVHAHYVCEYVSMYNIHTGISLKDKKIISVKAIIIIMELDTHRLGSRLHLAKL